MLLASVKYLNIFLHEYFLSENVWVTSYTSTLFIAIEMFTAFIYLLISISNFNKTFLKLKVV